MVEKRRFVIVVNPMAGKRRGWRTAQAVAALLRNRGLEAEVQPTTATRDAEQVARDVAREAGSAPLCVVACGGDGTMQQVANALATGPRDAADGMPRPALGLAPAGRCNDFARALGVSPEPATIADILAAGQPRSIDLGRVNGRFFCTVATVGVDADISSFVDRMRLPLKGKLAYVYGTLCVLSRYHGRRLRLEGDFGVIDRPIFVASSANTSSYGGAIRIVPHASPTDGQLDLCVIDDVPVLRSFMLLCRILAGRHTALPQVQFLKTRRLRVEAGEATEIWADGERIGRTPATIEAVPSAIDVLLNADRRFGNSEEDPKARRRKQE